MSGRRLLVSVAGSAAFEPDDPRETIAFEVGRGLVDTGFRVVTGGLGGVMEAAMRGAHASGAYRDGDTIAFLPGHDPAAANPWADIVIASGLDLARNLLVASSDALIAIGGGAGTLMELAAAWQLRRPVIALEVSGWSGRLAGTPIDHRVRQPDLAGDCVHAASSASEAIQLVERLLPLHPKRHRSV